MLSRSKKTGLWLAIAVLLVGAAPSRFHPTVGCSPATFTTSKGAKLIEATYNGTRYTFRVIRAGASALADINWGSFSLVRSVQLVTPDGRVANQLVFTDPTEQLRSDIRYRIKQIVKDQNGNDLKNEAGETVASLEPAANPQGSPVLAVLKDLPENVKTRIASFDEPTRQWFTFDYFAENSSAFRSAMDARPELVESWKYFKNGNVPDPIRTNPEWLGKLSDDLSNSKYNLKELFDESPGDIGIWKNLKDDPYHYRQLLEEGSLTDGRWTKWSQREFFKEVTKAGKQFENVVSNSFSSISQFKRFLDDGYKHLKQVYLKGGNTIIADDILIKADVDEFGDDIYKAVFNDSKLSSGSPWTTNQSDELIKKFRDNPSKEYLDFEVRTDNNLLTAQGAPVGFTQGTKVRIYRNEVFKTISDGNNGVAEVIKMADVNFR